MWTIRSTASSIRRAVVAFLVALSMGVVAGCSDEAPKPVTFTRETVNGKEIVAVPATLLSQVSRWQLSSTPLVNTPGVEEAVHFSDLRGLLTLSEHQIVAADYGSKRVYLFDSTGKLLRTVGRPGQGPLEYQDLFLVNGDDSSSFATYDVVKARLLVYRLGGDPPERHVLPRRMKPIHRFPDGTILGRFWSSLPQPSVEGVVRTTSRLAIVDPEGKVVTDFGFHPANDMVIRAGPRGPSGGFPPFPRDLFAGAKDTIVVIAPSGAYEVGVYSVDGRLLRTIRVERQEPMVTGSVRAAYRDSVMSAFAKDDYTVREWTMLSSEDVFPQSYPAFDAVLLDKSGAIWVRDYVRSVNANAIWTVFLPTGEPIAQLEMPPTLNVAEISQDRILGVWRDADGVEYLRVYGYDRR